MIVRLIVGFALVVMLIAVLFFLPLWLLPVVIAAFSVLSVHEMLFTTGFVTEKRLIACSMVCACAIPFWIYFGSSESAGMAGLFLFILALFLNALAEFNNISFEKLSICFFAGMLVPLLLSQLIWIIRLEDGYYLILIPFIAAYMADTFAFVVGGSIGKHKLAPQISPSKTVEGLCGGIAGAIMSMIFYGLVLGSFFGVSVNFALLILYAAVGSFSSVAGDLSMSYIKRRAKIKDFGTILPGHGGVLDRIDSLLFAVPATVILLILFPGIII